VVDVSTSKTGKHGHAKCNFTAIDIFTGKKLEDMCPSTHNVDVRTDICNLHRSTFLAAGAARWYTVAVNSCPIGISCHGKM
jgi:hypothetical protein